MKNNYYYEVILMNKEGKQFYSLKKYTSLQNARKFVQKEKETVRKSIAMKNGLEYRINKIDKNTELPVIIYIS